MTIQCSTSADRRFPRSRFGYRQRGQTVRTAAWLATFIAIAVLAPAPTEAADVQVVAHSSVDVTSISKRDLGRIFFKQRTRWANGANAKPIDQKMKTEVREDFSRDVLGRSLADVESYWNSQVFSGKNTPPPTAGNDAEVLDFVRNTPGAVGYVSGAADTSGLQVIAVTD